MLDFNPFYAYIAQNKLAPWLEVLPAQLKHWVTESLRGDFKTWQNAVAFLPDVQPSSVDVLHRVRIGTAADVSAGDLKRMEGLLQQLGPWRKGPFEIFGIHIDTEWRSDWKWDRVLPHISPLQGRYVLDVGCGSGYHVWRMRGAGAQCVIGLDPSQRSYAQFSAIKRYIPDPNVHFLPIGIDEMPVLPYFDTVFSMGLLYHRISPLEFLQQLKDLLRRGGELVLETLVVEGDAQTVLLPADRYAKMRNVWFIPSTATLTAWLERVGFVDVRVVDVCVTTLAEQRRTSWMDNESLIDFLDPNDHSKTREGYPAPTRAVLIAQVPE